MEVAMGDVVDLHGQPVHLEDDHELIENLARYAEGLLSKEAVKKKHRFDAATWEQLGENDALVEAIEAEKLRRIRNGQAKRELAQKHVVKAGAFAVPAIIAGELEFTLMTANASLFNSIAKGAPLVVILDRGHNRPGFGYPVMNVTQAIYDQGVHGAADFAKLKGKKVGVGALGSINQYNAAQALLKAGLDPAKDVQWIVNVPQPDLMRMLGQNQVDATDLAYQFGFFAQNNKWGPMVANGDQIVPGAEIATYAVRKDFLDKNRDAVVRFAMAYLQGIKEFNAAAKDPGAHPAIVDLLAQNTALIRPELV